MQTYFEKDYIIISYDKDVNAVVLKWLTTPTTSEFREGLDALIPAMEYFRTGKLITDTTYLGTLYPHDQEWAATDWLNRALKVGYSHIAIILPDDIFTRMSVEDTMSQVAEGITGAAYFNRLEPAGEWMKML
jgi:hypothetical protein